MLTTCSGKPFLPFPKASPYSPSPTSPSGAHRPLEEIDADLKGVIGRIQTMLGEVMG